MAATPMPRWAYDPARDRAPDREPLEAATNLVPSRFAGFVPADNAGFRYGLTLNDGGFFWEAHEVWEAVWKAAPMNGRDRLALQALIQIANAGLKQRQARPRAAARLIDHATTLLDELTGRGIASEPESIAGRLQAGWLREELACGTIPGRIRLGRFFSGEKMKENA